MQLDGDDLHAEEFQILYFINFTDEEKQGYVTYLNKKVGVYDWSIFSFWWCFAFFIQKNV